MWETVLFTVIVPSVARLCYLNRRDGRPRPSAGGHGDPPLQGLYNPVILSGAKNLT